MGSLLLSRNIVRPTQPTLFLPLLSFPFSLPLSRDLFSTLLNRSLAVFFTVTYKPILDEIERIQAEAGLEAEDMKKGGVGAAGMGAVGEGSRNRR